MKISSALPVRGVSIGPTAIDQKIKALMKRKQAIVGKIIDVVNGDDEQKVKEQKIKALRMEMQFIDLEIARLKQKKEELKKGKKHAHGFESGDLPPSPSDLIHPGPGNRAMKPQLDLKV